MKITIKFSYTEAVIPKGCRKPRDVEFSDGMLVANIPELTLDQAPIAIKSIVKARVSNGFERDFDFNYRYYKNKLWTTINLHFCSPHSLSSGNFDYYYKMPDSLIDLTQVWRDNNSGLNVNHRVGKEANIAELKKQLSRMVIIDGLLYRRAQEPMYQVTTFGFGNNHGGTGLFAHTTCATKTNERFEFNLFDLELATKYATQVATIRGDTNHLPITVNGAESFEILIPEAIKLKYSAKKLKFNAQLITS